MINNSDATQKYMFLSTIREIITNKPESLQNYIQQLMPLYMSQSNNPEEKIRNIVSESIGKLFVSHPNQISKPLIDAMLNKDALTVATCASSFKYSAHNNKNPQDFIPFIDILIQMIKSPDIEIKKNCLISLNSIAFNPNLKVCLKDKIEQLVGVAQEETMIKKELISVVDLGPFKHTVDKGEPIRKAAFSLLETVAENYSFDQQYVVKATIDGLSDTHIDVQQQCLGFLNKQLNICPNHVIAQLDNAIEKFTNLYQKNANNLKKEDEAEKATNLMRGVLKVMASLNRFPDATTNPNFTQWFQSYVRDNSEIPLMKQIYDKIVSSNQKLL